MQPAYLQCPAFRYRYKNINFFLFSSMITPVDRFALDGDFASIANLYGGHVDTLTLIRQRFQNETTIKISAWQQFRYFIATS